MSCVIYWNTLLLNDKIGLKQIMSINITLFKSSVLIKHVTMWYQILNRERNGLTKYSNSYFDMGPLYNVSILHYSSRIISKHTFSEIMLSIWLRIKTKRKHTQWIYTLYQYFLSPHFLRFSSHYWPIFCYWDVVDWKHF